MERVASGRDDNPTITVSTQGWTQPMNAVSEVAIATLARRYGCAVQVLREEWTQSGHQYPMLLQVLRGEPGSAGIESAEHQAHVLTMLLPADGNARQLLQIMLTCLPEDAAEVLPEFAQIVQHATVSASGGAATTAPAHTPDAPSPPHTPAARVSDGTAPGVPQPQGHETVQRHENGEHDDQRP